MVWNTYGPIDEALSLAYNWSQATVAMMANWGAITFVVAAVPLSWCLEARGLRETTVIVTSLISIGKKIALNCLMLIHIVFKRLCFAHFHHKSVPLHPICPCLLHFERFRRSNHYGRPSSHLGRLVSAL